MIVILHIFFKVKTVYGSNILTTDFGERGLGNKLPLRGKHILLVTQFSYIYLIDTFTPNLAKFNVSCAFSIMYMERETSHSSFGYLLLYIEINNSVA